MEKISLREAKALGHAIIFDFRGCFVLVRDVVGSDRKLVVFPGGSSAVFRKERKFLIPDFVGTQVPLENEFSILSCEVADLKSVIFVSKSDSQKGRRHLFGRAVLIKIVSRVEFDLVVIIFARALDI